MYNLSTDLLKRGVVNAALALVVIHVVGTAGFYAIAQGKASAFDAFYMTFITVATIGYAETVDLTGNVAGRVFNVMIAIAGIGAVWVMFSNFTALLLARAADPARQRRKLLKEICMMKEHYIVCGVGRVGSNVARELLATQCAFVAIDESASALEQFRQHFGDLGSQTRLLSADACEDDALQSAGIAHAQGVFAVTGDDSRNMLIALTARQLNPGVRIVARVHDVRNVEKCRRAGADEIVSPDFTGGLRIATAMLRPHAASFMDQMLRRSDTLRVEEVHVPPGFSPRPLGELELRGGNYIVVAARGASDWEFNPPPERQLLAGEVLIAIATPDGKQALQQTLAALAAASGAR
jgi:voltage-gated potassium channel